MKNTIHKYMLFTNLQKYGYTIFNFRKLLAGCTFVPVTGWLDAYLFPIVGCQDVRLSPITERLYMKKRHLIPVLMTICTCLLLVIGVFFIQHISQKNSTGASKDSVFTLDLDADSDIASVDSFFTDDNTEEKSLEYSESEQKGQYQTISAASAYVMMQDYDKSSTDYIIVDVRTQSEYDEEHIPGAILISDDTLEKEAKTMLPDKSVPLFVYCRSGRRSLSSAKLLSSLGYTCVYDFGGIIDWPYDTVSQ